VIVGANDRFLIRGHDDGNVSRNLTSCQPVFFAGAQGSRLFLLIEADNLE